MVVLSNLKEPNHCVLAKAILLGELGDPNPENTVEALHHMGLMVWCDAQPGLVSFGPTQPHGTDRG